MVDIKNPFNIDLYKLSQRQIELLEPVTSLDIFSSSDSANFHPQGLFSNEIFGEVGSQQRDQTFSYIDIGVHVFHPLVYYRLEKIKSLYTAIIRGEKYAYFDDDAKEFYETDSEKGRTGFAFFVEHIQDLDPVEGDSPLRAQRVQVFKRFRDKCLTRYILVMPAGLRDAEIDESGRVKYDEINDYYKKLIGISNNVERGGREETEIFDRIRVTLQKSFNEIYDYLVGSKDQPGLLTGKSGFIQGQWGKRRVFDGTRNVITAMDIAPPALGREDYPQPDDTVIGLHQLARGALPITLHALMNYQPMVDAFSAGEQAAYLIDPETYELRHIELDAQEYDRWTSSEGLEQVVGLLANDDMRPRPVTIADHYLALVYKPPNRKVFHVFNDISKIENLLEQEDYQHIYPLTYFELIYLCNYRNWNDLRAIITRYPVSSEDATYPSPIYVRTTTESEKRQQLDDNFEPMEPADENTALVYPDFQSGGYIDSTMVHLHRLSNLGGDRDLAKVG